MAFGTRSPSLPPAPNGELYLTALTALFQARGELVHAVAADDPRDVIGVNTRADLALAEAAMQSRIPRAVDAGGRDAGGPDKHVHRRRRDAGARHCRPPQHAPARPHPHRRAMRNRPQRCRAGLACRRRLHSGRLNAGRGDIGGGRGRRTVLPPAARFVHRPGVACGQFRRDKGKLAGDARSRLATSVTSATPLSATA